MLPFFLCIRHRQRAHGTDSVDFCVFGMCVLDVRMGQGCNTNRWMARYWPEGGPETSWTSLLCWPLASYRARDGCLRRILTLSGVYTDLHVKPSRNHSLGALDLPGHTRG